MRIRQLTAGAVLFLAVLLVAYLMLRPSFQRNASPQNQITFRLDSFAINLYPPTLSEINSRRIDTLLHEPLVRLDDQGHIEAGVATSWRHEGSKWRFVIPTGKRFSDGNSLTPQDVSASICRSMQPNSAWGWALASIKNSPKTPGSVRCDGISVLGNQIIVEQTFDAPWLIEALSGPAGWVIPAKAAPTGKYGEVPGAGPYRVSEVVPDSEIVLRPTQTRPDLPSIRFIYAPDDIQAASLFKDGQLASLYLQSPALKQLVGEERNGTKDADYHLATHPFDRVRVLILNESRLAQLGFSANDIVTFRDALDATIDRNKLAKISAGIAIPDAHVLPIFGRMIRRAPPSGALDKLPRASLIVVSEPDPFSDQIAAALPARIGRVTLSHRTLEKGLLINSIVKKDFDIASVVIEGTMHSPKFWTSFFDPNGAFVAFGKPVPGVDKIDVSTPEGVKAAEALLLSQGNWISLLRETRIDAEQDWLTGMRYSPSGQDDLSSVRIGAAVHQ